MLLNKNFNRLYIIKLYESLLMLEDKAVYEPGQQKEVLFKKADLLVDACRFYFKELYPLYYPKYKQQTKTVIFIILGNELANIYTEIFNNATFTRLAFFNLKDNIKKYYNINIDFYD